MTGPTYREVHLMVRLERGRPDTHSCVGDLAACPGEAAGAEWSCNVEDAHPDSLAEAVVNSRGTVATYSTDTADYVARCLPCHRKHDHRVRREERLLAEEVH